MPLLPWRGRNAYRTDDLPSYLNQSAATQAQLISVNADGHAMIKVDNTTSDPAPGPYSTFGRNTVLLKSKEVIDIGTLVVLDAYHIPYGVRAPRISGSCEESGLLT
jgi:hypothetical protein